MGNVLLTVGSGSPDRLIAASIDELGYVPSHRSCSYLRVQRLPQAGLPPHYNEVQNAQQMLRCPVRKPSLAGADHSYQGC